MGKTSFGPCDSKRIKIGQDEEVDAKSSGDEEDGIQPEGENLADGPQGQVENVLVDNIDTEDQEGGGGGILTQDNGILNDAVPGASSADTSSEYIDSVRDYDYIKEMQDWAWRLGLPDVAEQFNESLLKAEARLENAKPAPHEYETESSSGDSDGNERCASGRDPSRRKASVMRLVRKLAKKSRNKALFAEYLGNHDHDTEVSIVEPNLENHATEASASAPGPNFENLDTAEAFEVEQKIEELPVPGPSRTRANYSRTARPKSRKKDQN